MFDDFSLEMAHSSDFYIENQDQLNYALVKGKLKEILDLWLQFIEKEDMKMESKVTDFDDVFGWE